MDRRQTIWTAGLATVVVAGISLLLFGWNGAGWTAAARNTARFSGIMFALALVARSPRWPRLFLRRWSLFFAFVAAHGVHYATVVSLAIFDTGHELHQLRPSAMVTLGGGFAMLTLAALTAGTIEAPFRSKVHTAFFYLMGVIFLVGFGSRALHSPASAVMLGVVLLAFVTRVLPSGGRTSAVSASA